MKIRSVILIVSSLSFIILIVSLSLLLGEKFQIQSCGCPKMVSQNFIFLFILLSIIFVAGILYYLLSLQLDKKTKTIDFSTSTIMKFLDNDEKKILNQIKKNGIMQSEIKGMTKLRIHRAIRKLEEKEILISSRIGKTNLIKLNKNFKL